MKKIILSLCLISLLAPMNAKSTNLKVYEKTEFYYQNQSNIALNFINSYVNFLGNLPPERKKINNWVSNNKILTQNFKNSYKKIANGDFDPILDAQDYPDSFKIVKFDEKTNIVTVKGNNWDDFLLKIKLVKVGNSWLVDGCGAVNVPIQLRAKR